MAENSKDKLVITRTIIYKYEVSDVAGVLKLREMISERELDPVDIHVLPATVEIEADRGELVEGSAAPATDEITAGMAEEQEADQADLATTDQNVPLVEMGQKVDSEVIEP